MPTYREILGDRKAITLRLPTDIYERVSADADAKGESVNDFLSRLLARKYKLKFQPRGGNRGGRDGNDG